MGGDRCLDRRFFYIFSSVFLHRFWMALEASLGPSWEPLGFIFAVIFSIKNYIDFLIDFGMPFGWIFRVPTLMLTKSPFSAQGRFFNKHGPQMGSTMEPTGLTTLLKK